MREQLIRTMYSRVQASTYEAAANKNAIYFTHELSILINLSVPRSRKLKCHLSVDLTLHV